MARHAANLIVREAGRALGRHGRFNVALAGGSTPREVYAQLTDDNLKFQIVWQAVHLFWSDERCVPPDHQDSNYRMAHDTLISKIEIPESNVHRMRGEEDPAKAAASYQEELRAHFGGEPDFDLVILGMGADGHTASLFPGTEALGHDERAVTVGDAPDGSKRLSLTFRAINAARRVAILVSGEGKAETIRRVLGKDDRAEGLPIQSVSPKDGQLLWLLYSYAASLLDPTADSPD
jgi:6-phosphogluconolactonase